MSLAIALLTPDYAAIIADGKCVWFDESDVGQAHPHLISDDAHKLFKVTREIIFTAGGDVAFAERLRVSLEGRVQLYGLDDPDLFGLLASELKGQAQELGKTTEPENTNLWLVGWDEVQQKLRGLAFDMEKNFEPREMPWAAVMGFEQGKSEALRWLDTWRSFPRADQAIAALEFIMRQAAAKAPQFCSTNFEHILLLREAILRRRLCLQL